MSEIAEAKKKGAFPMVKSPVPFVLGADCSRFKEWLHERVGPDLMNVVREMFARALFPGIPFRPRGYVLTGEPASGKSTLTEVLCILVRDGHRRVIRDWEDSLCFASDIDGVSLHLIPEIPGRKIDCSFIKELVYRGRIEVCRGGEEKVFLKPKSIVVIESNDFENVKGLSWIRQIRMNGIVDQLRPIDFDDELPGILNWAISWAHGMIAKKQ